METYIHINVGIVRDNEKGVLTRVRGSKLSITVDRDMSVDQILSIAKTKHSAHDQFFCGLEDYQVVYPDLKVVHFIPGTDKKFTVRGYKQELMKPYSKLDLYLCKCSDLEGFFYIYLNSLNFRSTCKFPASLFRAHLFFAHPSRLN